MGVKGQFFSFDVFLALALFTISIILLFSFFSAKAPLTQQFYYADDITNLFANIRINEVLTEAQASTYHLIEGDYEQGKTINEVLRNLGIYNKKTDAKDLVDYLIKDLLPKNYGFSFEIDSGGETTIISSSGEKQKVIVSRERILRGT